MSTRTIKVDYLTRVEGEGSLYVRARGQRIEELKFGIFEPPRFFEAFLRGRAYTEPPDLTARICGICPVAYQMSACQAIEQACGVTVDGPLRDLRRLIYCGEWIESHALHVALLHAPDFLGYEDAMQMARAYPDLVQRALALKKTGNDLVAAVGGREIHPVNVRLGGFYRVPAKAELDGVRAPLQRARDTALELARFAGGLSFPELDMDYEFVALRHPDEYPINEGRLVSNKGLDIPIEAFGDHIEEEHVAHSNALRAGIKGRGAYQVGPLARYVLNHDRLTPGARQAASDAGLSPECRNPFKSIIVRAVELVYAVEESLRIIAAYEEPDRPALDVPPRAGVGHGCTEAPRGILYHRYVLDGSGRVLEARIVPPTAQNQRAIEEDLRAFIPPRLNLSKDRLTWACEQAIRNYDPCISCATHFLKLTLDRV